MSTEKKGMFIAPDGANLFFTFVLVSSLFFLWAVCNGMIDVMDKHFQEELHLSKVAIRLGAIRPLPGLLPDGDARGLAGGKLGYKGGIIAGLLLVALGGFWFIPATHINALSTPARSRRRPRSSAFLVGVCVIATGLTFLETIANPYTTVLGDPRFAATRINLAQSCNGVGWIVGPGDRQRLLLLQGRRGQQHRQPDALYSVRRDRLAWCWSSPSSSISPACPTSKAPTIITSTMPLPAFRTPSGRTRTSCWRWLAQFLYVAAQAGIFSFFINYMTTEAPADAGVVGCRHGWVRGSRRPAAQLAAGWFDSHADGLSLSDKGASNLASVGQYLLPRSGGFSGAGSFSKASPPTGCSASTA